MLIHKESIQKLINNHKDDIETLNLIKNCLSSFGEYHARIYKMETWLSMYGYHNMPKEDYQNDMTGLDKSRSVAHNTVISNIGILNRLCDQNNISPVYEGIVSVERPHRVEIADAVLAYVEEIVTQRRK